MSRASDIPRLIGAIQDAQPGGCALLTGTITTWGSGTYLVHVLGTDIADVPVLAQAGIPSPGDVVAVLRQKSSYLILGKIVPAGG